MKPSNVCLPKSEIPLLLSGDLPPDEVAAAENHIAECETCRIAIESMIADSRWWDDARHSLAASATRSADRADVAHDTEPTTNEQLLELLGPTDDPAMLGRIGVYEIVGILGHGGMGVVFKGYDGALNRFVAIKMLLPHLAASGAARKRFAREAQAAAAVVDDHVMAIHGVSEWKSVPYFVMPYARGVSLQKRLSNNGPLEVREILRIGMQAASGLAAAHAQGLVHRDVKPANIFLDEGVERVQLMDFGLARAVDDASLTRSGTLAGTPQYMSPEQARAETVDHLSDLFSLGSVMYAMCVGHAPFRAESSYSVLRLITDKEPRPIREINSDVPDWLCAIIGKLMEKKAVDRIDSAAQVAALLEDCLAHVQRPVDVPLPEVLKSHLRPRSPVRRMSSIGVPIMLAIFSSILFAMFMMQPTDDSEAKTSQPNTHDVLSTNLAELLDLQKAREESVRQLSYVGTVNQFARTDTSRTEGESNEAFIDRYTSLPPTYDELGPRSMSVVRDFTTDSGHIKYGDINVRSPKYVEWLFKGEVFTQLMGVGGLPCEATITKDPLETLQLQRAWSGWLRMDMFAMRPVEDQLLSTTIEKAAGTPGMPDAGGRPLFRLEKTDNDEKSTRFSCTFLHQKPVEIDGRKGFKQLWYCIRWEQLGDELVLSRIDELDVIGTPESMPRTVTLLDDYRKIDGVSVPFRVRIFSFGDKFVYGAEFVASNASVNGAVVLPAELIIPAGTKVRDRLTGNRYRQPVVQSPDSNLKK